MQRHPAQAQAAPALARDGRTTYVIALARDVIPAEAKAAHELAEYLRQITGATFAVRPEAQVPTGAPQILVGAGDLAAKTSLMQGSKTLGEIGDNEYHVLDLGRQSLNPAMYFYVAPARNPGVEAVYVDRVLLIREKTAATR